MKRRRMKRRRMKRRIKARCASICFEEDRS
jgi:hypothetical protein